MSFLKKAKVLSIAIGLILIPLLAFAAATTITSSGNWNNTGIWSSGNIGNTVSEDVDFNNNIGQVTILNGFSYTTSNIAMKNGNTLTIASGGTLNVGNTGTGFKISTGNTATINVHGNLTIWGDLDVGNTLTLVVTGTLTIKGDIKMGNGASLDIDGAVDVAGDFIAGNDATVNVDGVLAVGGSFTAGNGSDMSGTGTVTSAGGCSGPPAFCTDSPLPITLKEFQAKQTTSGVALNWITLTEENFEYFEIQRAAADGLFTIVETISGNGFSKDEISYSWADENPKIGINYYRLESVDFDGYRETFPAVSIIFEPENRKISISPNPINQQSVITLKNTFGEDFKLKILGLDGVEKLSIQGADNQIQLPPNMKTGIYLALFEVNGLRKTQKLIVR